MTLAVGWRPVAASDDLPPGHVYQTRLCDRPLAIWRSVRGEVNIWEDRCPHRGVRLSIGSALGDELRCQYHAWRFASGSGFCTHIPAQPDLTPPRAIRATVFAALERAGLVWTRLDTTADEPPTISAGVVLRAMPVNRPPAAVEAALAAVEMAGVSLFVQPVARDRSVIRGIAYDRGSLAGHDAALERLRRELEAA